MKRFKFLWMSILLCACYLGLSLLFLRTGISLPYTYTLFLFVGAMYMDHTTTLKALKLGGKEANPFARLLFNKLGVGLGSLVVLILMTLFIVKVFSQSPAWQQLSMACVYWIVPINNLMVIRRLGRKQES